MNQRTEKEIVEAAQQGDTESLGVLYERYFQAMAWLAYSVVLDRRIRDAAGPGMPEPDFKGFCQGHAEDVELLRSQVASHPERQGIKPTLLKMTRIAALILIVLGLGFVVGRLTVPGPPDLSQLRAELETSLNEQLIESIESIELGTQQLRTDILEQVRHDLGGLAKQTLAASKEITDQQMTELIQLLEETRIRDRQHIAAAFELIEANRLHDLKQLGSRLQRFAVYTDPQSPGDIHQ